MDSFYPQLKASFDLSTILITIFWSAVITVLFKYALKAFGHQPTRKAMFWGASFLLIFVVLFLVRQGDGGSIKTQLDTVFVGNPVPHDDKFVPDQTPIMGVVSARNTGRPSVLEGWELKIKWQDDSVSEIPAERFPDAVTITLTSGKVMAFTRDKDSIVDTTLSPINGGAMVRGVAVWVLPKGRTRDDLLLAKKGTIIADDITGATHEVDVPWHTMVASGQITDSIVMGFPGLGHAQEQGQQQAKKK